MRGGIIVKIFLARTHQADPRNFQGRVGAPTPAPAPRARPPARTLPGAGAVHPAHPTVHPARARARRAAPRSFPAAT